MMDKPFEYRKVGDIMVRDVATIKKDSNIASAIKIIDERNIGSIIVVDNENKVVGIITEKDIIKNVSGENKNPTKLKVEDVMSTPVTIAEPSLTIIDANKLLEDWGFEKLPIVENGRLIGIVTEVDLANAMRSTILEIRPAREDKFSDADPTYKLTPGLSYLIKEERPERAFDIFTSNVLQGVHGLCVTRYNPDLIRGRYGLEKTPIIWLTQEDSDDMHVSPYQFSELSIMIGKYINKTGKCIILFDGIEYLITHNTYAQTLKLIQALRDKVSKSGSHLIVSINEKTLDEKEMKLLELEMDVVIDALILGERGFDEIKKDIMER